MKSVKRVRAGLTVLALVAVGCSSNGVQPTASVATSPTARPTENPDPDSPVEVTGRVTCGPYVSAEWDGREETLEVGDAGMMLTRNRHSAYHQTIEASDPRLEGDIYHTFEADIYHDATTESGPGNWAATHRIENADGAWESRGFGATFADGTPVGEPAEILVGEGAYDGLVAILEVVGETEPCTSEFRGIIFDGAPVPEPYRP